MAIAALMRFTVDGDALQIYDSAIEEMGAQENPARGAVYHWVAKVPGGLYECDVWESVDIFERFSREHMRPITARHGVPPPLIEVHDVYNMQDGDEPCTSGVGVLADFRGDTQELLAFYSAANTRMHIASDVPVGLVFHFCMPLAGGIRIVDHWRSQEYFDSFMQRRLGPALRELGAPLPHLDFLTIHNAINARALLRV